MLGSLLDKKALDAISAGVDDGFVLLHRMVEAQERTAEALEQIAELMKKNA